MNLKILEQAIPKLEATFPIFTEFMPFISLCFNSFPAFLFIFYLIKDSFHSILFVQISVLGKKDSAEETGPGVLMINKSPLKKS